MPPLKSDGKYQDKEARTRDELVNVVAQKTGLSPEQSKAAAQAVIDYLKGKLPGPVAGRSDSMLKGSGGLGGRFGKE